jgi:hypothetical protein
MSARRTGGAANVRFLFLERLARTSDVKNSGRWRWDEAKAVAVEVEKAGKWEGDRITVSRSIERLKLSRPSSKNTRHVTPRRNTAFCLQS